MIRLVVTDLDGTLLNDDHRVSHEDYFSLVDLGTKGVVRVIATGRSAYSFTRVIPDDFPIDYLIFSSGAGIIKWADKSIIHARHIPAPVVHEVATELVSLGVDFMVHEQIPHNHFLLFHSSGSPNEDFLRRIELYHAFCRPYIPGVEFPNEATQLLAVLPNDLERFTSIGSRFPDLKVIRTTSPLDGQSIWMEIFPSDVSKAYGISWLCKEVVDTSSDAVAALGNDFNDIDMLEFAGRSFVVANAPEELRNRYTTVSSHNESGFSDALRQLNLGRIA